MKKFLIGIISLSLLLPACKPSEVRIAQHCQKSTVVIHMKLAKGDKRGWGGCSGVYVTPNLILTADHCVDMSIGSKPGDDDSGIILKELWIKNYNGNGARATVVKQDPTRDLALLKTSLRGTPVHIARDVQIGETCYVVGNPLGLQFIVSQGIVSQMNVTTQDFPVDHFITDAVVLPGNSGGPCFNSRGELIGIVTMSTSLLGRWGATGLGFVVQLDEVQHFLNAKSQVF